MNKFFITFSIITGCLMAIFLFAPLDSSAQTSDSLIITWQANNYFPADYPGKAAATPNSPIVASIEVIRAGKLIDITKSEISWFINNGLIANGIGTKTISFSAKQGTTGYETLTASVKIGENGIQNSVRIPISKPIVVISHPSSRESVKAGGRIELTAIPLFFNVSSLDGLSFDWRINGQKISAVGNRITAEIGTPQSDYQNSVNVSVTVQNKENLFEFNRGVLNLSVIK